jgi:hypothetical protein
MRESETNIIIFSRVAAAEMQKRTSEGEKRNLESFLKYLKKLLTA